MPDQQEHDYHHNNKLAERVGSHDSRLVRIETLLEGVLQSHQKQTESIIKIEKLLTKLDHIETDTKESFVRIHKRVDQVTENVNEFHVHMKEEHKVLEPVVFLMRYPKFLLVGLVGMYLFTIKEFRDAFLMSIGIL